MSIENKLINATNYGGNVEKNQKSISASQFKDDLLRIYYRYKIGVKPNDKFDQATIGSLMHIAIQGILSDYENEKQLEVKMDNGWSLTGSIDLLSLDKKEIIDIKVTKQYTVDQVKKDLDHQYIWQVSVYRYLVYKLFGVECDTKLMFILKDGGFDFRTNKRKPSFVLLDVEPKGYDEVEAEFENIVSMLEDCLSLDLVPDKCEDLWWRKTKNNSIPVKCQEYCSYNKDCKYYNPHPLNAPNL